MKLSEPQRRALLAFDEWGFADQARSTNSARHFISSGAARSLECYCKPPLIEWWTSGYGRYGRWTLTQAGRDALSELKVAAA